VKIYQYHQKNLKQSLEKLNNNLEEIFETEEYVVYIESSGGVDRRLLVKPRKCLDTEVKIFSKDFRKVILLSILLAKSGFTVCVERCEYRDYNTITIDHIILDYCDNNFKLICKNSTQYLDNNLTIDNILKLVNEIKKCRDRENTTLHRV